jgi:hypothetical protein
MRLLVSVHDPTRRIYRELGFEIRSQRRCRNDPRAVTHARHRGDWDTRAAQVLKGFSWMFPFPPWELISDYRFTGATTSISWRLLNLPLPDVCREVCWRRLSESGALCGSQDRIDLATDGT